MDTESLHRGRFITNALHTASRLERVRKTPGRATVAPRHTVTLLSNVATTKRNHL